MPKTTQIGATLKLEGEKEFRQALRDVNSELKENASEMKLVDAQYADNNRSMQALTARSKVLTEQVRIKTEKVATLEKALDAAKKEYGENSKQAQGWQTQLNNARADLEKTTHELEANSKAMKHSTELTEESRKAFTKLGAAVAGMITALAKMTIDTAKSADEILTLSKTTGLATDQIQKLQYAEGLLDVSTSTISGSMTKLLAAMKAADKGSKDQAAAFDRLHISVRGADGQMRSTQAVFFQAIDALKKVKNETDRDSLAMTLFGKSAKELNPLIEAGSGYLKQLGDEAERMGYVMDEKTLNAFGELDDAMQRFNKQGEALRNSLAVILLPILTALFEAIAKIPVPVLRTMVVLAGVITTVVLAVKAIKTLTDTGTTIMGFFNGMNPAMLRTTGIIMGVVAALIALAAIIAAISGKSNDVAKTMNSVGQMTSRMQGTVSGVQTSSVPRYARGTEYAYGGLAEVGENGPELVMLPRGARVIPRSSSNGTTIFNVTISSRDMENAAQVAEVFEQMRQRGRAK